MFRRVVHTALLLSVSLVVMTGEFAGIYYPVKAMDPKMQEKLVEDHFLFKRDDSVLGDAGGYKSWDKDIGIFHNKNKTFRTWVNDENHFRFISMQMGGKLGEVYQRVVAKYPRTTYAS